MSTLSRVSLFAMLIPAAALLVYTPQILEVWLGAVPEKAALFTRILLISIIFRSLHDPLNIMYMSIGKIKRLMIIESLTMVVFFFIVFSVLKSGAPIWSPFVVLAIMELIIIILISWNAKIELGFPINNYFRRVIIPMVVIVLISGLVLYYLSLLFIPHSVFMTIFGVIIAVTVESLICFMFMERKERYLLYSVLRKQK